MGTHKFGIEIFEIDLKSVIEIEGYLTFGPHPRSPVDPRVKLYPVFCSSHHPLHFDMPHDHIQNFFDRPTPWAWLR